MKSPPAAPAAGAYSAVSRKLMASMGWSEGKGLGKHEQGADKHIEHKKRGDNVGLGADATVEAQFAAGLHKGSAKAAFGDQGWVDAFAGACVEINQCVGCTREFFTKSFLGDDACVLARSSGEEPASPRHRAGVASTAWRTTR